MWIRVLMEDVVVNESIKVFESKIKRSVSFDISVNFWLWAR